LQRRQRLLSSAPIVLIEFVPFDVHFPDGLDEKFILKAGPVKREAFPGYHHMCAFWAFHVFNHPKVRDLQYYMRLDTDSYIKAPIRFDIFKSFQRNGWKYGYRNERLDAPFVTVGMWEFDKRYSVLGNIENSIQFPSADNYWKVPVPQYSNNIEIVHVPTFQQPQIIRFLNAVRDTHYIYWRRWGDAPIRYFTVALFLNKKDVHFMCYLNYVHQNVRLNATCAKPELL